MKKHFLIFAAISAIIITSCSKEKIGAQSNAVLAEEFSSAKNPGTGSGGDLADPLNMGLLGRFEFNGNLNEMNGKLAPGIPTKGRAIFTTDRKGASNKAIRFNENYGVMLYDVPLDTNMSVSVWIKYDMTPTDYVISFVEGSRSFVLTHSLENRFMGGYWSNTTPQYVLSRPLTNAWHHMVATRDNNELKYYIDGVLIGISPAPVVPAPSAAFSEYSLGYCFNLGYKYWKGNLDDLRIYKRVLSSSEVNSLYKL